MRDENGISGSVMKGCMNHISPGILTDKEVDCITRKSKREAAEMIWLLYFNQTLFEKGLINESERNRMRLRIETRRPSASGKNAR